MNDRRLYDEWFDKIDKNPEEYISLNNELSKYVIPLDQHDKEIGCVVAVHKPTKKALILLNPFQFDEVSNSAYVYEERDYSSLKISPWCIDLCYEEVLKLIS